MIKKNDISDLLMEIRDELKKSNTQHRLWDTEDIALYLKLSKKSVQNRIICKVSFPQPIRIPTDTGFTSPRWKQEEVTNWTERFYARK